MKLKNKVAIITGAGSGIGEATAYLFAQEGAKITSNSLSESGKKVAQRIQDTGGAAIFVRGDVSQVDDAERIVGDTVREYGRIDILVNNAGVVIPGRVDDTSVEDWDKTFSINVRSVFLMSKFAFEHLKKTKGTIINVASSVALKGVADRAGYTASKGALLSLTRAMATDYIRDGIRVNCICPGTIDTLSLQGRLEKFGDPAAARERFIRRQPMGRFGEASEIAEGLLYLASAEFCTGSTLSVDGGMTA
jgi:NAD(P)-dependent dehydrogenase (short-subunit alcohol dehydrogenase family)